MSALVTAIFRHYLVSPCILAEHSKTRSAQHDDHRWLLLRTRSIPGYFAARTRPELSLLSLSQSIQWRRFRIRRSDAWLFLLGVRRRQPEPLRDSSRMGVILLPDLWQHAVRPGHGESAWSDLRKCGRRSWGSDRHAYFRRIQGSLGSHWRACSAVPGVSSSSCAAGLARCPTKRCRHASRNSLLIEARKEIVLRSCPQSFASSHAPLQQPHAACI